VGVTKGISIAGVDLKVLAIPRISFLPPGEGGNIKYTYYEAQPPSIQCQEILMKRPHMMSLLK